MVLYPLLPRSRRTRADLIMDEYGNAIAATPDALSRVSVGARGQSKGLIFSAAAVEAQFDHILDCPKENELRFLIGGATPDETTETVVFAMNDAHAARLFATCGQAHLEGASNAVRIGDGFGLMVGGGKHAE